MGKTKRAKRGKALRQDLLGLAGAPQARDAGGDAAMVDEPMPAAVEAVSDKAETRGEVERRQQHERKLWRLEERDLRRQRNKIKKGTPAAEREKKRLLKLLRTKESELKARHAMEMKPFLGESGLVLEDAEAPSGRESNVVAESAAAGPAASDSAGAAGMDEDDDEEEEEEEKA